MGAASWRRLREIAWPRGGLLYRGASYLGVDLVIGDLDAARAWLPSPLRLAGDTATLFVARFPHSSFGSVYLEAGLLLPASHRGRRAAHCPWMVVDDDVALILGREVLGYPKKLATLEWRADDAGVDDGVEVEVSRRGRPVLTLEARLGPRCEGTAPIIAQPQRNLRGGPFLSSVVAFTPRARLRLERSATVTTRFAPSDRDPLHELRLHSPRSGRLRQVDLQVSSPPRIVGLAAPLAYARLLRPRSL